MLVGKINENLEHGYFPEIIKDIIKYLHSLPLNNLETGKHSIPFLKDNEAWFVILEYNTEQECNFKPEVHRHYSDLQILLSGQEKMGWCMDTGEFKPDGDYIEHRDILYYQRDNMPLNYIDASEGYFYLFTPSVVHFTNVLQGKSSPVRKLVVKINNNILMRQP